MSTTDAACEEIRNLTLQAGFAPPHKRPIGSSIQFVQFIVQIIVLGMFLMCFAYFKYAHPSRDQFYRLHPRPMWGVFTVHCGAVACMITGSYLWSHELEVGVPCWIQLLASFTAVPMLLLPTLVRLYNFYHAHELTKTILGDTSDTTVATTGVSPRSPTTDAQQHETDTIATNSHHRSRPALFVLLLLSAVSVGPLRVWLRLKENSIEDKLQRLRLQTSQTYLRALLVLALLPYFVSAFVFLGIQHGVQCYGCRVLFTGKLAVLIEGLVAVVLAVAALYLVRSKQDSFSVLSEIRSALLLGGMPALVFYALEVGVGVQGEFSFFMLIELCLVVFCYFQSLHQCLLAVWQHRLVTHAEERYAMTYTHFLAHVIAPQGAFHAAFCKHQEREHSVESMSFLGAVDVFEKGYYDVASKTNAARMRRIISMYVGHQAVLPCNLSGKVVLALRSAQVVMDVDMFAEAREELCTMLYRDAFVRFKTTAKFRELHAKHGSAAAAPAITAVVPRAPSNANV